MATHITKNFSVDVKFTRNDEETLCIDDMIYLQLLAQIKKSIVQQCEASMGIHEAHMDGDITVT